MGRRKRSKTVASAELSVVSEPQIPSTRTAFVFAVLARDDTRKTGMLMKSFSYRGFFRILILALFVVISAAASSFAQAAPG